MSNLDADREAFEAALRATQQRHDTALDVDLQRLQGWMRTPAVFRWPAHLAQAVAAAGARPSATPLPLPGRAAAKVPGQVNLGQHPALRQIDAHFIETFQLSRYWPGLNLDYPTVFTDTLEEFCGALVEEESASPELKAQIVAGRVAEAQQVAAEHGGGIFGVNLPGRGCYINGWLVAHGTPYAAQPRTALSDPQIFQRVLRTIAHEKLGHGLITELTPLGQEKKQLGLATLDLAQRFDLHAVETPATLLLRAKHQLVFKSSVFTEEGWSTWIEQALLAPSAPPLYTLDQVLELLDHLETADAESAEMLTEFKQVLGRLLGETSAQPDVVQVHLDMFTCQALEKSLIEPFSAGFGQSARYVLGYLLLNRIAAQAGWLVAPYAVLIAANLRYDLAHTSVGDLALVLEHEPRMNVDTRLALLAQLKPQPANDVPAFVAAAFRQFNLTAPDGLRAAG